MLCYASLSVGAMISAINIIGIPVLGATLLRLFFFWPQHVACRILVPPPGWSPGPGSESQVLTTGLPGNSLFGVFLKSYLIGCSFGWNDCDYTVETFYLSGVPSVHLFLFTFFLICLALQWEQNNWELYAVMCGEKNA